MNSRTIYKLSHIVNKAINEAFDFNNELSDETLNLDFDDYVWACQLLYNNFLEIENYSFEELHKIIVVFSKIFNSPDKITESIEEIFKVSKGYNYKIFDMNEYIKYNGDIRLDLNIPEVKKAIKRNNINLKGYSVKTLFFLYMLYRYAAIRVKKKQDNITLIHFFYPFSNTSIKNIFNNYQYVPKLNDPVANVINEYADHFINLDTC